MIISIHFFGTIATKITQPDKQIHFQILLKSIFLKFVINFLEKKPKEKRKVG
jgi:hypothetical protein